MMIWAYWVALLLLSSFGGDGMVTDEDSFWKPSPGSLKHKVHHNFWKDLDVPGAENLLVSGEEAFRWKNVDGVDMVKVEITAQVNQDLIGALSSSGTVLFASEKYGSITAQVPASLLINLASRGDVHAINPPHRRVCHAVGGLQGVISMRVNTLHASGFKGAGVKVGVISDSVDYLTQVQQNGDLPVSVNILSGQAGAGTGEGTAILQIVYNMAPEAILYFATAGSSMSSFATNIVNLANAGCNIIIDDIGFVEEPVYEDGIIAQAVDQVNGMGVSYFSAAGNSGSTLFETSQVYEGDYVGTTTYPFDPGAFGYSPLDINEFEPNKPFVTIHLLEGQGTYILLDWADSYTHPQSDYDLLVFNTSWSLVAYSITNLGFEATEYLPSLNETLYLVVARQFGDQRFFGIRTNQASHFSPSTNGQIYGHAAARGANGIGAIDQVSPSNYFTDFSEGMHLTVEFFSSQGPRRIYFQDGKPVTPNDFSSTGGLIRKKPDFTAADGVSSATPGFNPFFGTSAAAPHAGSLAALALSADPTLTPSQVHDALKSSSLDIETPGWDDTSGWGVLDGVRLMTDLGEPVSSQPSLRQGFRFNVFLGSILLNLVYLHLPPIYFA